MSDMSMPEDIDELPEDYSDFCECGLEYTVEEMEFNQCDCCGKRLT